MLREKRPLLTERDIARKRDIDKNTNSDRMRDIIRNINEGKKMLFKVSDI